MSEEIEIAGIFFKDMNMFKLTKIIRISILFVFTFYSDHEIINVITR